MAIALDTSLVHSGTGSFSFTTSGSNRLLVAYFHWVPSTASTATAVTYGGVAMTQIGTHTNNGAQFEMWYLINPASGANTFAYTNSGTTTVTQTLVSYTGVHQTSPLDGSFGTISSASFSSTAPVSGSVTTLAANSLVVSGLTASGSFTSTDLTVTSPAVIRQNTTSGTGLGAAADMATTTPGTFTVQWNRALSSSRAGVGRVQAFREASTSSVITKTQTTKARIAISKTLTQTATSRIARTVTKTQSATANITTSGGGGGNSIPTTNLYALYEAKQETGKVNNDQITSMIDRSGNGYNLFQVSTAGKYFTNVFNGQPAYNFAGAGYYQASSTDYAGLNVTTGTLTIAIVAQATSSSTSRRWPFGVYVADTTSIFAFTDGSTSGQWGAFLRGANNAGQVSPSSAPADTVASVFVLTLDAPNGTVTLHQNGTSIYSDTVGTSAVQQFLQIKMGSNISQNWIGNMAVAAVWTKALSSTERSQFDSYVQDTYGITVSDYAGGGSTITKTQPSTARIANNRAITQTARSRVSQSLSRTQGATSRVAKTTVKTQSSTTRVSKIVTRAQGATARIAKVVTKTQSSTARISKTFTKTQTATSRIAANRTSTQSSRASVSRNFTSTQTATARISVSASTPAAFNYGFNQSSFNGLPYVQIAATKTQPAVARVATTRTKTQSLIARIALNASKVQAATARVSVSLVKTQTAKATIGQTATKTQSATARVSKAFTKTQSATARIMQAQNLTKTQSATSRIAVKQTKTQNATARISKPGSITQTARATISKTFTKTQTAKARLANTNIKTQTARAYLGARATKIQTATAYILSTYTVLTEGEQYNYVPKGVITGQIDSLQPGDQQAYVPKTTPEGEYDTAIDDSGEYGVIS